MRLLTLLLSAAPWVASGALPEEVAAFVRERELCEHFRNEPVEGDAPEDIARRRFVQQSIEIHCAGTDRRLAALRARYADDAAVIARLQGYETAIEAPCRADP